MASSTESQYTLVFSFQGNCSPFLLHWCTDGSGLSWLHHCSMLLMASWSGSGGRRVAGAAPGPRSWWSTRWGGWTAWPAGVCPHWPGSDSQHCEGWSCRGHHSGWCRSGETLQWGHHWDSSHSLRRSQSPGQDSSWCRGHNDDCGTGAADSGAGRTWWPTAPELCRFHQRREECPGQVLSNPDTYLHIKYTHNQIVQSLSILS